jgi:hypothetical protein
MRLLVEPSIAGLPLSFWSFKGLMGLPLFYIGALPTADYEVFRVYCNVWSLNGEVRA